MWLTVFVSHNREQVKMFTDKLSVHDIIYKVIRKKSDMTFYEVFVPQTELAEAQNIIFDSELLD